MQMTCCTFLSIWFHCLSLPILTVSSSDQLVLHSKDGGAALYLQVWLKWYDSALDDFLLDLGPADDDEEED